MTVSVVASGTDVSLTGDRLCWCVVRYMDVAMKMLQPSDPGEDARSSAVAAYKVRRGGPQVELDH